MQPRRPWWALAVLLACSATDERVRPTTSPPVGTETEGTGGISPADAESAVMVRLRVEAAPSDPMVTVEASDDRLPLFGPAPLGDGRLELPPGFWTITVAVDDERRIFQLYGRPGAEIVVDWRSAGELQVRGAERLDREAAQRWWGADMERLLAAGAGSWNGEGELPAALQAALEAAQADIDAAGAAPYADLLRLRHASYVAQILGADSAWPLVEQVRPDSIAWAAYAPHLLELAYFLRPVAAASAHLAEVRARIDDPGVRSAFRALTLLEAESTGDERAVADAVLEGTDIHGPLVVGEPMPPFVLQSIDGGELRSAELAGPLLLEVWSTWCDPCVDQMEELHALHDRSAGQEKPLRLVSININDTREPVRAFRAERWPMPWSNAWVPGGDLLFRSWGLGEVQVPFAVLVDADGVVIEAGRELSPERARELAR